MLSSINFITITERVDHMAILAEQIKIESKLLTNDRKISSLNTNTLSRIVIQAILFCLELIFFTYKAEMRPGTYIFSEA